MFEVTYIQMEKWMNRSTKQCIGVLGLVLATGTADAQEMFSVNLFAYGRGLADEWQLESWREVVRVEGTDADTTAGLWETSNWENIAINGAVNPINGDSGSTARLCAPH